MEALSDKSSHTLFRAVISPWCSEVCPHRGEPGWRGLNQRLKARAPRCSEVYPHRGEPSWRGLNQRLNTQAQRRPLLPISWPELVVGFGRCKGGDRVKLSPMCPEREGQGDLPSFRMPLPKTLSFLLFFFFPAVPRGLRDPSSPVRAWTWSTAVKAPSPKEHDVKDI